jgi:hypothetical protein
VKCLVSAVNLFRNGGACLVCGTLAGMGAMYVLAIGIYVGARIIRRRQGIDLGLINKEIPVE